MRLIYITLDGAPGSIRERETAYSMAKAEGLDTIGKRGVCGCFYPLGPGRAPESDVAVMSILGYTEDLYPGRGAIEAMGIGYSLIPGREIALRGNLSTVDLESKRIIDRRAGRHIGEEEARALIEPIGYIPLRGGEAYARVFHTVGYRVLVVIGSKTRTLSPKISNMDPAYRREGLISVSQEAYDPYVKPCVPLDNDDASSYTCELIEEFIDKVSSILDSHRINVARESSGKPKANFILLRDAGGAFYGFRSFQELHGLRGAAIVDMPVEVGIARAIGLDTYVLSPSPSLREEDLLRRLELTRSVLERYEFVYIHLKGPDEPGHDGDCHAKKSIIERIDRHYIKPLLEAAERSDLAVAVLSDHATPCALRSHSADPVPIGIFARNLRGDGLDKFDEFNSCRGSLGVIPHGTMIIGIIKRMLAR